MNCHNVRESSIKLNESSFPPVYQTKSCLKFTWATWSKKSEKKAREVLLWPGMNHAIEETAKQCEYCQKYQNKLPAESLQPHPNLKRS